MDKINISVARLIIADGTIGWMDVIKSIEGLDKTRWPSKGEFALSS
jgi:hypothetical protein